MNYWQWKESNELYCECQRIEDETVMISFYCRSCQKRCDVNYKTCQERNGELLCSYCYELECRYKKEGWKPIKMYQSKCNMCQSIIRMTEDEMLDTTINKKKCLYCRLENN